MPLLLDQDYVNLKNQIIKAERRVLKELGFCVHVKHPHKVGTRRPKAPRAHLSRCCILTHPRTLMRVQCPCRGFLLRNRKIIFTQRSSCVTFSL